ncbi:hypothetical protein Syun_012589 [Stephania yunnanensis]|uniref:Uncharacterized protein n=1 Tax=Stephania yunnanensis TaxID=152371 RepID=A0AAP0K0H9_9MAGN
MLMAGDLALASLQTYNDSLLGFLKHTMIEHEAIFRWQVHELHRLYRIQKTLMEGSRWKEFKGCNSWASSVQSNPLPLQERPTCKLKEVEFALSMVDLTQTSYQDCSRKAPGTSHKVKPISLDLQLPADDYFSHFDVKLAQQSRQVDSCSSLKEACKARNLLDDKRIDAAEEVKLSLGAGKDTWSQESRGRCTILSAADVIDLDGSVPRTSLRVEELSSSISPEKPSADIGGKSQFQVSAECDMSVSAKVEEEPCHWVFKNCALKDLEKQGHESVYPGFDVSCPSVNKYKRKLSNLCQMEFVDLNRVQLEESSWFTDAPSGTLPSPAASSSAVSQRLKSASHTVSTYSRKPNSDSCYTSYEHQSYNAAYSTLTDAEGKDNSAQASSRSAGLNANSRSKIGIIDLESLPEDSPELADGINGTSIEAGRTNDDLYQGQCSFLRHDSKGTPDFKLADGYLCKSVVGCLNVSQTANDKEFGQESCEKSEEDAISSSICRSNVTQGECYGDSVGPSQVTETDSRQLDVVPKVVDCACVNGKSCLCSATKRRDPDVLPNEREIDCFVARAAVSLLHISLGNSNCCEYSITDDGTERLTNEPKEKPQSSSDSFESIVLRLKNNSTDDYCVTSAPINENITETNIKGPVASLRRGRRLKDFQRDVLPGLVSLSRREICEDLHSIGGFARANDYRKSRIKKGSSQIWFQPLRSRCSRFNNVC